MECKGIREKLSAYLEGVISAEEKGLVEEHLSSCPSCATVLEDLKKTSGLVKGLEEIEPPAWLAQRVMARIRTEEAAKKGLFRRLFYPLHVKIPIEAVATVMIAVVALYVFRSVEPKMNAVHAPSAPEQILSREEPSKPAAGPDAGSRALEEKAVAKAPLDLAQKRDRADVADERAGVSAVEEKEVRHEAGKAKEGLLSPKASEPVPAEATPPSVLARKKDAPVSRTEEPTGGSGSMSPQAMPPQSYLPAPQAKQKALPLEKDVVAAGAPKGRTLAAPKREAARNEEERVAAPVTFTVHARDVKTAADDAEILLRRLGIEKIERESVGGTEVFVADLQTEKAKDLFDSLRRIGEVTVQGAPADKIGGSTRVRIEIKSNP